MSEAVRSLTTPPTGAADVGLLLGRVVLGVVFVVNGWQKWSSGISTTQDGFDAMGVPAADASAIAQASLELGGGVLLIAGVVTPLVGGLLGVSMLAAAWFAHRDAFLVADGGAEFVLVLAATSFLLALVGPGRYSVDAALRRGSGV